MPFSLLSDVFLYNCLTAPPHRNTDDDVDAPRIWRIFCKYSHLSLLCQDPFVYLCSARRGWHYTNVEAGHSIGFE